MLFLRISHSTTSGFNAKGKNATTAMTHLQNARLIGGMLSLRPRAMIKLPDQIAVAPIAKKWPEITCRFCSLFVNLFTLHCCSSVKKSTEWSWAVSGVNALICCYAPPYLVSILSASARNRLASVSLPRVW